MTIDAAASTLPLLSTVTTDEKLAALGGEWDELLADSTAGGIFLTWPWISAWRDTIGRHHRLRIVTARHPDDGRLLGIAPFGVERRGRGLLRHRALVLLGSGPAAPDHLDLIVRREYERSIAPALWSAALRTADWDLIDFDGLSDTSWLARLLLRRHRDRDAVERIPVPFIELPDSWEAYESRLGDNLRRNLRRDRRRLDRDAPAPVTERLVVAASDVDDSVAALGRLHQAVRRARGDAGAFATEDLRAFHHLAARRLHDAGRLRLHRLDIGETPIAAGLCFRYGDVVSAYITGYDPGWGRYSPGVRLLARTIDGAIGEGARFLDLLRGDEEYKWRWAAAPRHDLRIRRPASLRGRVLWSGRNAVAPLRGALRRR